MWAGAPQLLIIPFVPMIMKRVDSRLLVAFGFLLFGISCVMNGYMSPLTAGPELRLPVECIGDNQSRLHKAINMVLWLAVNVR